MNEINTNPTRRDTAEESQGLLGIPGAGKALNVSKRTVQTLMAEGKIGFIRFGRNVRFHPSDIQKFIDSHRVLPVGWKNAGGSK